MRVNRAFAMGRAQGAAAGLALLDECGGPDVRSYPYVHLVRGALLEELGRMHEAGDALQLAREHARNAAERSQIEAKLARVHSAHRQEQLDGTTPQTMS